MILMIIAFLFDIVILLVIVMIAMLFTKITAKIIEDYISILVGDINISHLQNKTQKRAQNQMDFNQPPLRVSFPFPFSPYNKVTIWTIFLLFFG